MDGIEFYGLTCKKRGLSTGTIRALLQSVTQSSLKNYMHYWKLFSSFSAKKRTPNFVSVPLICEFLMDLYKKGVSSSTLNLARSAISFFTSNIISLKDSPVLVRLFQFFYRERPKQVRYLTYWPVEKLLKSLCTLHPASSLSLKSLTIKTLALVALSSSDRGQTLHCMNVEDMTETSNGIDFVIFGKLKTKRRTANPKVVSCVASDLENLSVCDYVKHYMERTASIRSELKDTGCENYNQLFLSWFTKQPVTKQTLARWLRIALEWADIDSKAYGAHSYRGAGLSYALTRGVSIAQIVAHGDWSSVRTFRRFYDAPDQGSSVGKIILNKVNSGKYKLCLKLQVSVTTRVAVSYEYSCFKYLE